VDFMASSQAFREYLKKLPPRNAIPSGIPDESVPLYLQRLEYYRRLYRPKQVEEK
ncbi:TPA: protein YibT, partial [Escherichia coli]